MTERPILFSGPMVRALLDGSKTQTRRVINPVQPRDDGMWPAGRDPVPDCPYGKAGDRLWVREAWACTARGDFYTKIQYRADGQSIEHHWKYFDAVKRLDKEGKYRPGIHMHRWASRISLLITDVRVQRLHDISEEDARAEGAIRMVMDDEAKFYESDRGTFKCGFAGIWSHINGAASWDANPWVFAVSFRVEQAERAAA